MTKIQTSISRRGQLEWVIENLPVNVLLVAIHRVDTRYLWKSWVWSRYDQYGGCEDDDGDDDDAKPADAPITGLVGPFPPPLLYWNSTQALKRTKWWRSFESLSLLIIKEPGLGKLTLRASQCPFPWTQPEKLDLETSIGGFRKAGGWNNISIILIMIHD